MKICLNFPSCHLAELGAHVRLCDKWLACCQAVAGEPGLLAILCAGLITVLLTAPWKETTLVSGWRYRGQCGRDWQSRGVFAVITGMLTLPSHPPQEKARHAGKRLNALQWVSVSALTQDLANGVFSINVLLDEWINEHLLSKLICFCPFFSPLARRNTE